MPKQVLRNDRSSRRNDHSILSSCIRGFAVRHLRAVTSRRTRQRSTTSGSHRPKILVHCRKGPTARHRLRTDSASSKSRYKSSAFRASKKCCQRKSRSQRRTLRTQKFFWADCSMSIRRRIPKNFSSPFAKLQSLHFESMNCERLHCQS